jgi:outer membrane autotransporter protein
MKKILIAAALVVSSSAFAVDLGVYGGYGKGTNGHSQDMAGVSAGQKFGSFGVQGTFDRSTSNVTNVNRYTVTGSYDVFKLGSIQTNVRAGVAYLDPQSSKLSNGGAALIGAGISYPVTKQVSLVADYAYQKGNNITKNYNGNIVTAGAKYSF